MEVDVRLGRSVVAPDLAGWRREKMPTLPDETPVVLVPDWVCEVISPGTEVFDRSTKADWYQECGVGWLWLVDPEARTLEVYENDAGQFRQRLRFQGETAVRAPPFEEVTWPLSALWG
jgi:Uma2 family endonuclease